MNKVTQHFFSLVSFYFSTKCESVNSENTILQLRRSLAYQKLLTCLTYTNTKHFSCIVEESLVSSCFKNSNVQTSVSVELFRENSHSAGALSLYYPLRLIAQTLTRTPFKTVLFLSLCKLVCKQTLSYPVHIVAKFFPNTCFKFVLIISLLNTSLSTRLIILSTLLSNTSLYTLILADHITAQYVRVHAH